MKLNLSALGALALRWQRFLLFDDGSKGLANTVANILALIVSLAFVWLWLAKAP